jgi:hypothetical protein
VVAPDLGRERRRLPDDERLPPPAEPATDERLIAAARTGHAEMREKLRQHTESSPSLFGGDVDARWEDAYASGEEAPGGSNPTPDQDRVDDIGKALGITYESNQDLQGGEEVAERDRHRWEYDPASSEDWPHDKHDKKEEK